MKGSMSNLHCCFVYLFAVSLFAGKRLYVLKAPAGNVMIRVFKIMGVRNVLKLFDSQPLLGRHATLLVEALRDTPRNASKHCSCNGVIDNYHAFVRRFLL